MSHIAITHIVRNKRAQIECTDLRSGNSASIHIHAQFLAEAEVAVRELTQKYRSMNYFRFQDELAMIEIGFGY